MKKIFILIFLLSFNILSLSAEEKNKLNGYNIVKKSFSMWRGQESSSSTLTMTIIRPNRNESMSLKSWSKGDNQSISKFIDPTKYQGQAILVQGDSMWAYYPKSRRSIKISNSLKSKPWMGSDMYYDEILVSLESLNQYSYSVKRSVKNKQSVYIIEAIPYNTAPIIMGKEVYYIRISDNAMLSKEFFDKKNVMTRRFDAIEIGYYKNDKQKPIMKHMRVTNLEKEGYFTDFKIDDTEFNVPISEDTFSLVNLERS